MIGADAAFVLDGQYYAFRPDSWDWDWLPAPTAPDGVACSVGGNLVLTDREDGDVLGARARRAGVEPRSGGR